MELDHVLYEVDGPVAIVTLNRPEAANAQSEKVLTELDHAWTLADRDKDVKVIVMRTNGKHFSAGHDMSGAKSSCDMTIPLPDALYDWETRGYLAWAKKWRDVPKPTIAAVQGKCIAAGLMLCWPCDLIIAADNAEFSDPVLAMGICGVEYHAHTWEMGPRKAKEILFMGSSIDAVTAERLGMVNKVVPLADLEAETMEWANRIAQFDPFALRMAKRAVNRTLDIQGFNSAIDAVFDMHEHGHSRATIVTGGKPSLAALGAMKARQ